MALSKLTVKNNLAHIHETHGHDEIARVLVLFWLSISGGGGGDAIGGCCEV
jgi:hypothetical protein